jgi:hypothetical protein
LQRRSQVPARTPGRNIEGENAVLDKIIEGLEEIIGA